MVIVEQGDDAVVTVKGTGGDSKPISVKYSVPFSCGPFNYSEGAPPQGMTVVAKRVEPRIVEFTVTRDGKQVANDRAVLSADERPLLYTRSGVDPNGKPVKGPEIYNRQ